MSILRRNVSQLEQENQENKKEKLTLKTEIKQLTQQMQTNSEYNKNKIMKISNLLELANKANFDILKEFYNLILNNFIYNIFFFLNNIINNI